MQLKDFELFTFSSEVFSSSVLNFRIFDKTKHNIYSTFIYAVNYGQG